MATAYVSQVETGAYKPGRAILKSISARFSVNEEWLLTGKGDPYLSRRNGLQPKRVYPLAIGPPGLIQVEDPGMPGRSDIDRHQVVELYQNDLTHYLDMARVILVSEDEIVKEALKSNLRAFARQIENEKKIKYLEEEVTRLRKSIMHSNDPTVGA